MCVCVCVCGGESDSCSSSCLFWDIFWDELFYAARYLHIFFRDTPHHVRFHKTVCICVCVFVCVHVCVCVCVQPALQLRPCWRIHTVKTLCYSETLAKILCVKDLLSFCLSGLSVHRVTKNKVFEQLMLAAACSARRCPASGEESTSE